MIEKYISKGSARPIKKVLGVVIGLAGAGMVFGIDYINNIISGNQLVFGILLLGIAYLLIKSGRQL